MENRFLKLTNTVYKLLEFFPESDPLKHRAKDRALVIMENLILANGAEAKEKAYPVKFAEGGVPTEAGQINRVKLQICEDIDILLGYLWIGKTQGWLNSSNCLIVSNEYERIKEEFSPVVEIPKQQPIEKETVVEQEYFQTSDESSSEASGEDEETVNFIESLITSNPKEEDSSFKGITARQQKILEFLSANERAQVVDLKKILPDVTKRTIRRDLDELMELGKIIRMGSFNQIYYQIKRQI